MAVFKYVEDNFVCYLACDSPEVNSPEAFRDLCRKVFVKACPVTVGSTFGVGLLPVLTEEPLDNLAWDAGLRGEDCWAFLGEFSERVWEALRETGVSLEVLGYYFMHGESEDLAAERDRLAAVYWDADVIRDFDLTDLRKCPFCGGIARVREEPDGVSGETKVAVECANYMCGAQIALIAPKGDVEDARVSVVEAWNLRVGK
ncbi:Lar family restriction alleviation protein [Caniella muris]|uniref:Lar family restriction alleviation protein n=1 Tax=Caniella muris TaxID=2941502 RepID=UPI00203C6194|nr:Lar family restriction alleviation protein [Caniella muris]